MTFLQLWDDALDIELASADTSQLFTTARRKKAVNDAVGAFVRMTDCVTRIGSIAIVDETATYDLETTLTDYIRLYGSPSIKIVEADVDDRYIQGDDDFPRRDVEQLDADEPGWRATDAGTPSRWLLEDDAGASNIILNPPPDVGSGETWTIRVPYVALPPDMTADGHLPFSVPVGTTTKIRLQPYHQGLAHYAAALLEPLRKNYAGAQRQMTLFNGYVAMYLQDERVNGPDQITVVRDYFSESIRTTLPVDPRRWP